jgi:hypothetical protein
MLDGEAVPQPGWSTCSKESCNGIRVEGKRSCLAHVDDEVRESILAALKPKSSVDLRGTPVKDVLLARILAAVKAEDGTPRLGDVSFEGAQFTGSARFEGAQFTKVAWFHEAQFTGNASFDRAQFTGHASFEGARFTGHASFSGAQFTGDAWFNTAEFTRNAGFRDARFTKDALFQGTRFTKDAWFYRTQFTGSAWFSGAQFTGDAWFDTAEFTGNASFEEAQFTASAWFRWVGFTGDACFHRATFEEATELGPLLVLGQLRLDGAVFTQRMQIEAATAALSAQRARFPGGVQLRLRWAQVRLDDADLAAPSILTGVPPFPYLDERAIADDSAEQPAPLGYDRRARPRLLSLQRADVAGLTVANVDLRACRFLGAHNLDKLRLETPKPFARSPGWKGVKSGWRWPPVWWWTRRAAVAEEHEWRTEHEHDLRRIGWQPPLGQGWVLTDVDHWIALPPPVRREPGRFWRYAGQVVRGWRRLPRRVRHVRGLRAVRRRRRQRELGQRRERAGEIANLYRALRKGREDNKDEPGAADFYYGEMELRRAAARSRIERWILNLYWLVSGYGLRAWRALATLLAVVLLAAVVFAFWGFLATAQPPRPVRIDPQGTLIYEQPPAQRPAGLDELPAALRFSAQSATALLRGPDRPLTPIGEWLHMGLRLAGPVLLALAVLALRGRVKR